VIESENRKKLKNRDDAKRRKSKVVKALPLEPRSKPKSVLVKLSNDVQILLVAKMMKMTMIPPKGKSVSWYLWIMVNSNTQKAQATLRSVKRRSRNSLILFLHLKKVFGTGTSNGMNWIT
jgi:hypothetical protein